MDSTTQILCTIIDEPPHRTTLGSFFADNAHDDEISALRPEVEDALTATGRYIGEQGFSLELLAA